MRKLKDMLDYDRVSS